MDCSDLPVSGNGAWVLNTRNGMCNSNTGKMMQMHEWNFKQGGYTESAICASGATFFAVFVVNIGPKCIGGRPWLRRYY